MIQIFSNPSTQAHRRPPLRIMDGQKAENIWTN